LVGALYGSVLLFILKSLIGSWTEHHLIVIGLLFMGSVLFLPKGLIGLIRPYVERRLVVSRPAEESSPEQPSLPLAVKRVES
jgi:branched-chain amino acid transport system permease protein